jgi:peptidoglycan/LPS O-acetylase OafA/YrhL
VVPLREREPRLPYLPALDGVRAVAVAAVLLFHGGVRWASGGFLGVDVFFALSGFLITSLLLHEVQTSGTVRLRAFWARRARRLLPALVAVVIVVCLYAANGVDPTVRARVPGDAIGALLYFANWHFAFTGNSYFDRTALPSPLQHTWSLGIEEQFYAVWPVLVLLCVAAWRLRHELLAVVCGIGALGSVVWMVALHDRGASVNRLYYGTDTRAVALLCGAAIGAIALRATQEADRPDARPVWWRAWSRTVVGVAALLVVVALVTGARDDAPWLYPWGFLGVALATSLLIAALVSHPRGPVSAMLSTPPLVALGRISYGVYLWHWPVYQMLDGERTGLRGPSLLLLRLAVTGLVSVASYHLVEQPMRRRGGALRRRVQLGVATGALVAAAAAVAVVAQVSVPELPGQAAAVAHADVVRATPVPTATSVPTATPVASASSHPTGVVGVPGRMLVVGDSVGLSLGSGVRPYFREHHHDVIDSALLGCGIAETSPLRYFGNVQPQPSVCNDWPDRWHRMLVQYRPQLVLLVVGRWEVMDRMYDGRWSHVGEPAFDAYLGRQLDRAFEVLGSTGARVATVTAPYYRRGERPDGGLWPEDETWRVDAWNALLRAAVGRHPGVALVDLNAKMAPDGGYENYVDGIMLREDGVHLTSDAGWWLAPWLLQQLDF